MTESTAPSQSQLLFPLLETLRDLGSEAKPADVYPALADRLGVSEEERTRHVQTSAGSTRTFDRNVRWARQRAVLAGYVSAETRNVWALTEKGGEALLNAKPGIVLTVFETDNGVALWCESQSGMRLVEDGLVSLIVTSPPYVLAKKKAYASQFASSDHLEWLLKRAEQWKRVLADDGSLFLNLGCAWTPGKPTQDIYLHRLMVKLVDSLGFHLAQEIVWDNPSKMPAPAQWVTVERIRLKPSTESVFWLSKTPRPKADNRKVLREYSPAMKALLRRGGERGAERPSGYVLQPGAFSKDNGGAIASNLLSIANTDSNSSYLRYCRARGLPKHPARFPAELCEFAVKLTTDEGDVCLDDFGGSFQFAEVCERMNRRWISMEKSGCYIAGGVGRFTGVSSPHPSQWSRCE